MQSRLDEFKKAGAEIAVISVDSVEQNKKVADRYGITFPILSDAKLEAVDAFDLRHIGGGMEGEDIARPATFIADEQGRITWRYFTENWRVRVRPEEILAALESE